MKPSRLKRMANNIAFQIPEIPSRLIKKSVSVPRRRAKIPEMGNYKEQNPEQEERCLRFN
jgi:hypothetical protein